jgi:hypothetical protein
MKKYYFWMERDFSNLTAVFSEGGCKLDEDYERKADALYALRVFMQGAATEPLGNGFVLMECYK